MYMYVSDIDVYGMLHVVTSYLACTRDFELADGEVRLHFDVEGEPGAVVFQVRVSNLVVHLFTVAVHLSAKRIEST